MKSAKLFETVGLPEGEIPTALKVHNDMCVYEFSLVWTLDGSGITLGALNIADYNKYNWKSLVARPISESDGEISVPMSMLKLGSKIDMLFNIFPHQNIASAAIQIVNLTTATAYQVAPAVGYNTLTKGIAWTDLITVTLK